MIRQTRPRGRDPGVLGAVHLALVAWLLLLLARGARRRCPVPAARVIRLRCGGPRWSLAAAAMSLRRRTVVLGPQQRGGGGSQRPTRERCSMSRAVGRRRGRGARRRSVRFVAVSRRAMCPVAG